MTSSAPGAVDDAGATAEAGAATSASPRSGGGPEPPLAAPAPPWLARLRRHDTAAVAVAAALCIAPLAWVLREFRGIDDAQITFVFARSFAEGQGLTWKGAAGLGTSSPFLAVLLGSFAFVTGGDVAVLGVALGWVAIWTAAVALYLLGRLEGWRTAGALAALAWILVGFRLHLGGEYLPAAALALVAAVAFRSGRPLFAGVALAFAALFRAEVGLAAPIFAAARLVEVGWRRGLREVARAALVAITITVLWLGALWAIAGTVLPQTMEAKRVQAESELGIWDPGPRLAALVTHPGAGFPGRLPWLFWALALLGAAALALRARRAPFALATLVWGVAHGLALAALGVAIYPWYATPIRLAAYLLACLAAELPASLPRGARRAAVVVVTGMFALAFARQLAGERQLLRLQHDPRSRSYGQIAEIADRYAPGTELGAYEVGFVGYATRQPVVDLLGLVTPEASLEAVRSGDLAGNVTLLEPELVMTPLASGSLYYRAIGEPRAFLSRYRLDHLVLDTRFPVALYRARTLAGQGDVAVDLLVRPAREGRVFRVGTRDLVAMLALGVRGGQSTALRLPPGSWGGLRVALSADGAGARAELVLRTPPATRRSHEVEVPDGHWRWDEAGPLQTERGSRLVLRCLAPPETSCRFGQPHLLRPRRAAAPGSAPRD
jgi:hypothetical protein